MTCEMRWKGALIGSLDSWAFPDLRCKERIDTVEVFEGKMTRSHSAALSDWINGKGAAAQFVAFAEVYKALERGILDCGVTGADPAYGQRWYEVTQYMNGPLHSFTATNNIVNAQVWGKMPRRYSRKRALALSWYSSVLL